MGAFADIVVSEKARKENRKANKIQEKVRQSQDARARVAQIRQARMAQAQVVQSGATQGAMNSSAVQGGFSAIGSNAENNIQFINQIDTLQQSINRRMEKSNDLTALASGIAQVKTMAASAAGGGA
tara:strand:- start:44 stop:421 length:378 start_codon:yes stop_codon:yes gene_type:complete